MKVQDWPAEWVEQHFPVFRLHDDEPPNFRPGDRVTMEAGRRMWHMTVAAIKTLTDGRRSYLTRCGHIVSAGIAFPSEDGSSRPRRKEESPPPFTDLPQLAARAGFTLEESR